MMEDEANSEDPEVRKQPTDLENALMKFAAAGETVELVVRNPKTGAERSFLFNDAAAFRQIVEAAVSQAEDLSLLRAIEDLDFDPDAPDDKSSRPGGPL